MSTQIKDKFYDNLLKSPTKESFRKFIVNNYGELNELDFKEKLIEYPHLAKTILAMSNSGGGIIVFGIKQEEDGGVIPVGLEKLEDKAIIDNGLNSYIPSSLRYGVLDFSYDSAEYDKMKGKKFQLLVVYNIPSLIPFFSIKDYTEEKNRKPKTVLNKNDIYVRRGTKCEKATVDDINSIITARITSFFKETSDLSLEEHLTQLKVLYNELPQKIKVLIRKGESVFSASMISTIELFSKSIQTYCGTPDEYEEQDNPEYPGESYEEFINRMIERKKIKIEKTLDLK